MKLLFDQNLSRRLVPMLLHEYPDSVHVTSIDMDTASDTEIWSYAAQHGYAIVSKDSDFRQLSFVHGAPPKTIWVRSGNASTLQIYEMLRTATERVQRFADHTEEALLVLSGPAQ